MKRDLDLIRALMFHLEQAKGVVSDRDAVDGYSRDEVAYHLALIIEDGLAEGRPLYGNTGVDSTIPVSVAVMRLTSAGHDFIDSIRDARAWSHVKKEAAAIGVTLTLKMASQLAQKFIAHCLGIG